MPTRLCSDRTEGGCPNPATYRGRCQRHAKQRNKDTHRNREIYNSKRWQILRRRILFDNPLCSCGEIATDVHHIKDIEDGGDPWSRANCLALCHSCHSQITRAAQAA
jgi:hypothetical protein